MKVISINEAEAIIESFWDGGTSDFMDTDIRYKVLDEYEITSLNGAKVQVKQGWAFASVEIQTTQENKPILSLKRNCMADVSEYDTFIVFCTFPQSVRFDLFATIDGNKVCLYHQVQGKGMAWEYNAPFSGKEITELELLLYSSQSGVQGTLGWFGLAHSKRL